MSTLNQVSNKKILLVGNPNVGKSALFQALSGQYVEVSNYPGTTVELAKAIFEEGRVIVDTPGVYGVSGLTDEEKVTLKALKDLQAGDLVINVVSALSLTRDLFLTLHLLDLRIPFVLVFNQIDEARRQNLKEDFCKLGDILKVQTFVVSALTGEGITELQEYLKADHRPTTGVTSPELVGQISQALLSNKALKNHFEALLWLEEDLETLKRFQPSKPKEGSRNKIYEGRRLRVNRLTEKVAQAPEAENALVKKLNEFLIHPLLGTIFSLLMAFFFLYQVLGVWVAGDLVNLLEKGLFEKYWNPSVRATVAQVLPVEIALDGEPQVYPRGLLASGHKFKFTQLQKAEFIFSPADLIDSPGKQSTLSQTPLSSLGTILAGKYGILTLTVTYLLGLLVPLVWFFYFSWALFEDSGYLPRIAVLADGFLRKIGLNGRGVIPLVLGLGCVTMAVVTTRLMSNKREQLILMVLLGIAVPCSAQLGIIQGLLVKVGGLSGWLIWLTVLLAVLCLCGFLANKVLPGRPTPLLLDLPPLRLPRLKNLLQKANQKSWFFLKESGVAFFWASLVIAFMQVTGLLSLFIQALKPLVAGVLHLPKEVALSFLLGMVRRDFGAFGLLDLELSKIQAITACVTLTLFVPCIATLGVMVKERNFKTAFGIWLTSWLFGFGVGGVLTRLLELSGMQ